MKKIFAALLMTLCMAGVAVAQDMAQATELAKQANESLVNGDNEAALAGFRQALEQASLCGEEGFDLVTTCKSVIPKILLNQAKASIAANEFDAAVEKLKETASVATEYEQVDAAEEANALVPQVLLQKANQLLNAKDYNGAVSAYKDVLDVDPANGNAYLRMGMAYNGMNNLDSAIDAFDKALENTPETSQGAVKKQLSTAYLKKANGFYKAKQWKEALEFAQKSIESQDNANAEKIVGNAASQLKQNKIAAEAFEAYLTMKPNAADKVQVTYQLGTVLQALGDKEKACGYFKTIQDDPKFGEGARYQITQLKCN
ncbi:MAG: tetratricopeptide repeat protein [Bacteroidales bacterium]|nr:tetratricopeptide repeat protein [Bacteroidales bacterium]